VQQRIQIPRNGIKLVAVLFFLKTLKKPNNIPTSVVVHLSSEVKE